MVSAPSQSARSDETDALLGSVIGGRFRVDARLAAGGMGVVYRAEQIPLGRPVALKVLKQPPSPDLDENFSKRFLLEAAALASLNHPHTIVVHDYGHDADLLYFAMEYLEGSTLTEHLDANGPMHPADAIHVAEQVARSLQDAHAKGLVHRDLKPSNVMLVARGGDPLFVKVLDFGLVKLITKDAKTKLTQSGIMLGSPRYMAPEQVRGSDVDHRADIYAFGAMLCFMLTGKPPFPEGSQFEAMRAHVYQPAPRLRELFAGCQASERLESIVLRCLEKSPDARFPWMGQIVEALGHAALAPVDTDAALDDKPTLFREPSLVQSVPAGLEASSASRPIPATVAPHATAPSADVARTMVPLASGPSFESPVPSGHAGDPARAGGHQRRGASTWLLRVGLVALFVTGAAAAAFLFPKDDDTSTDGAGRVGAASLGSTSPVGSRLGSSPDDPAAPVGALGAPSPEPPAQAQSSARAYFDVRLDGEPTPARVTREGADLGDAPLTLRIPEGERWELEVSASGHVSQSVEIVGVDGVEEVRFRLRAEPASARPRATSARPSNAMTARERPQPVEEPPPPPRPTYRPELPDPWDP